MKKGKFLSLFLSVCFWAVSSSPALAQDQLTYVGASTVGVFIHEAAKVYKGVVFTTIDTEAESGGGEDATVFGKTDIGGVSREVKQEFIDNGVKKFFIGKDAIGVWVNSDNPVNSLYIDELKDIFTGKIENWKDVGGQDLPINVYIVNPRSATRKVFQDRIMSGHEYGGKRIEAIHPDPVILDKVAADKGGIGQLSFSLGINHPASGKLKKINIGNQTASVSNQNYPITRPLYLLTKGEPTGAAKAFIDWTLSDDGQAVVKKFFVGIK